LREFVNVEPVQVTKMTYNNTGTRQKGFTRHWRTYQAITDAILKRSLVSLIAISQLTPVDQIMSLFPFGIEHVDAFSPRNLPPTNASPTSTDCNIVILRHSRDIL
jgi:hypothetical protein